MTRERCTCGDHACPHCYPYAYALRYRPDLDFADFGDDERELRAEREWGANEGQDNGLNV